MATGVTRAFRLLDLDVRNSVSPSDLIMYYIKDVTLSSSSADVDLLQYLPYGSKIVSYTHLKQATTTFTSGTSNTATFTAAVAGASAKVDFLVFVEATKMI